MQRFVRRKNRPQPGRGPARWTGWEIALMALSVLLIVFPLYAEGYRWLNPQTVPAAPLLQRATFTSVATSPTATTGTAPTATATATAGPSPTPTATATTGTAPTATATPTQGTPVAPTNTPTNGPSPTATATLTPLPNEPPLRLDKAASASSVQIGQKF